MVFESKDINHSSQRTSTNRKSVKSPDFFRDLQYRIYANFFATRAFRNQFPDKSRIRDQWSVMELDYRYVDQAKHPWQGQIILVPPSTNQSIIYVSPLQIIEQPTTTNSIQTAFVSPPANVNQSVTVPQAVIPPAQTASAQAKSTLCRKSGSRYLTPQKKISKFFCDFGECKLSFHSVEDLRWNIFTRKLWVVKMIHSNWLLYSDIIENSQIMK